MPVPGDAADRELGHAVEVGHHPAARQRGQFGPGPAVLLPGRGGAEHAQVPGVRAERGHRAVVQDRPGRLDVLTRRERGLGRGGRRLSHRSPGPPAALRMPHLRQSRSFPPSRLMAAMHRPRPQVELSCHQAPGGPRRPRLLPRAAADALRCRSCAPGARDEPDRGEEARRRFTGAVVARLATVTEAGQPHLVPVTFAVDGDRIYSAVDAKPKTTVHGLRRLRNIRGPAAGQRARRPLRRRLDHAVVARADGVAAIWEDPGQIAAPVALLAARYPQYRDRPPGGPGHRHPGHPLEWLGRVGAGLAPPRGRVTARRRRGSPRCR